MEETNSNEIFIVKLFIDKEPIIFKFKLPEDVTAKKTNSTWDQAINNFKIPDEVTSTQQVVS